MIRLLIAVLILGLPLAGQTREDNLTLADAVNSALQNHPSLKAAGAGQRSANAALSEANSNRLPTVQVKGTLTHGNNPVYVFGSLLEQSRFAAQNFSLDALNSPASLSNLRTELDVRLPVFDQRKTSSRIQQASIGVEQGNLQYQAARQQIRFEVIRAYFGLVAALARKDLADASVEMANEDVKRAGNMRDAGMTLESDVLAARVQLADFRQQQIQAQADAASAAAALNVAMGRPADGSVSVNSMMKDRSFELRPQVELISLALAHRPDYLIANAAIRSAAQSVTSASGASLPRVDVFGRYGASISPFVSGSGDYTVGANITIDLFDASRNSRVDRARADREVATADAERLANQIRLDVVRAHQNQIAAEERVGVARLTREQSEEVHRVVRDRYQAGLATIVEVLRAEMAVVQARTSLIASQYAQRMSYADVLFATGMLTDEREFGEGAAE